MSRILIHGVLQDQHFLLSAKLKMVPHLAINRQQPRNIGKQKRQGQKEPPEGLIITYTSE